MGIKNFLSLVFLAALWSPTFVFIKLAAVEIPPSTIIVGSLGIAALFLYLLLRLRGRSLPEFGPIWKHFAVMAIIQHTVPFFLLIWGTQYIDSALAAILNGAGPLFTIILAHYFAENDRLTRGKLLGLMIGFGGLLFLIAPALFDGVWATSGGLIAVTTAAACFGIAIVYANLFLRGLPPLVAPTAQLSLATFYVLPLALFVDNPFSLPLPSLFPSGALLALAFVTFLAVIVYYYVIERVNPSHVSMATYLVPVMGIILGVVLMQERLYWNDYAGCSLILLGVMTVNGIFRRPDQPQQRQQPVYGR